MSGAGDNRDNPSWVVLELTRAGEVKAEEGFLAGLLREILRVPQNHPVFVPSLTYVSAGHRISVHLMEGYAFMAAGLPETSYLGLENCPYVRHVLTTRSPHGMRTLSVIPDSKIADMRSQLAQQVASDVITGMHVTVTDGVFGALDGHVVLVVGDDAHVRITLRSLDLIAKIPRVFLCPVKEV